MVAHVRPLKNRARWKHSFSVNSCLFLAFDSLKSSWALQLSRCQSALLRSLNEQWCDYGVPFGLQKKLFLFVTLLVENGRETKTHSTKDQQSNIIGSHTVSDTKYLFSQREKRRFAPSGSSPATYELEFLRKGIGTQNFELSDIHVYSRRYSYQKNATSACSEIEKPINTLKTL